MNHEDWLKRWQENRIGFHKPHPHPLLTAHYGQINLKSPPRIFVPLCGKSHDIGWLLTQGAHVVASELSHLAIEQLFSELGITPHCQQLTPNLAYWQSPQLEVYIGDIFTLRTENIGVIDAIYDRGAMVALPPEVRPRYSELLCQITANAAQLLITFDYDQSHMQGPPFSVPRTEIEQYYGLSHQIEALAKRNIDHFKNTAITAREIIYKLIPKANKV